MSLRHRRYNSLNDVLARLEAYFLCLLFPCLPHRLKVQAQAAGVNSVLYSLHQIHMFLAFLDPDPLDRGMDPDPSINRQK
jgi:hypothetical protein